MSNKKEKKNEQSNKFRFEIIIFSFKKKRNKSHDKFKN